MKNYVLLEKLSRGKLKNSLGNGNYFFKIIVEIGFIFDYFPAFFALVNNEIFTMNNSYFYGLH